MIKVKYSVIGGENEKIVQLAADYEVTNIEVNRKIDINTIKEISKTYELPEHAIDSFIYSIIREFMHQIVCDLVEATQYIDDAKLSYEVTMYCKKIDRDEVPLMTKEQFDELRSLLNDFFNKHWDWKEVQFNDKEFMENVTNKD